LSCPPEQFVAIGGVVAAILLGTSRRVGKGRPATVIDDVEVDSTAVDHPVQQETQVRPRLRRFEAQSVRAPSGDRLTQRPVMVGHRVSAVEGDGRKVGVVISSVRVAVDGGAPPVVRGGHLQVIQHRATAHENLSARAVGVASHPLMIGEQAQCAVVEVPPPRLAVVQRRCAAS